MTLSVDITSDVICPWCYIGKRRLEKAIAARRGQSDVRVRWHPFQLNPHMSKDGMNRGRNSHTVPNSLEAGEHSLALDAQVNRSGPGRGHPILPSISIERTPNTLDAHRLIWLAEQEGVQDAVVEGSCSRAYFTEGSGH